MFSENITKVLYPNDEVSQGKKLRLQQQYFFVTCSLQDMIRVHLFLGRPLETFHEKWAVQLNDTHPAIAIAELMRLLIDEHQMDWDTAWDVTRNSCAYTNHTLLPEALEKWPVEMFRELLPRHLEIIYEINHRFLDEVRAFTQDQWQVQRMSLIDENGGGFIRMANLATVGSHKVNGVARLHSDLLKQTVMSDFAQMWPEKFCNVTNGVTPRRFMALANPPLAKLISASLNTDDWLRDLDQLRQLEPLADDPKFQQQWRQVKLTAKEKLAGIIEKKVGEKVDPNSLFDIQVKRIHEYKRQHLNILHVITLYNRIKANPDGEFVPRTFVFGGKAAPGYYMAKLIIRLINGVAEVVNHDPDVRDRLKVIFYPDFNVKNAEPIYPAADISEQISMAGKEASGTGNMKFSMNGALTIGTLDGANVEIREEVGAENFFLFGLDAKEVFELKAGGYNPQDYYHADAELKDAIGLINSGLFSRGDTDLFMPLAGNLMYDDTYLVMADYRAYVDAQDQVSGAYRDADKWTRMSILNVARIGKFSSDRSIRDYCEHIWNAQPVVVG
jgi:starch phosphorylase